MFDVRQPDTSVRLTDAAPDIARPSHQDNRVAAWHDICLFATSMFTTAAPSTTTYARRQPETTVLYEVVRDHFASLLDEARDRSEYGFGYPRFVEREFEKFLACGLLCHGFVRVRCGDCGDERLVAFSCKTRGFCPSCTSRRMTGTAAHLVERVLPTAPYRQWVLSLPRQVRFLLARDRVLFGRVISAFLRKVFAWQRRRARVHGIADPHTGAVTFVQRFGSLLNLNCHAHALVPDGVFATGPDGAVSFHALPAPRDDDVVRLLGQIARAIHRLVERRLADLADDAPADLLAFEQADAVDHVPALGNPMGPTRGRRSAFLAGYSLHADRLVDADDRDGLERLCRYGARSPVANSRLAYDSRGQVVMSLKRPLRDGRTELTFAPVEFLRRLATLIPPPYAHLTRFHGVFAPHHRLRAAVVPASAATTANTRASDRRVNCWSALMKRVFAVDVLVCDTCGGAMRILAVLPKSNVTHAFLDHLGLPTAPPQLRAHAPPRRLDPDVVSP